MSEDTPTTPLNRPEMPVISHSTGNPGRSIPIATPEAATAISEYIKPTMIRYPMYNWQTGTNFFLSKTEKIVVDAYLKTNNESEATRALNAIRGAHGSLKRSTVKAIRGWLKKPHVAQHIAEQYIAKGKVNWFDADKWEAWGVDVMHGKQLATQVQVAVWKEYGKSKGWYKDTGPQVMNNMQINFVQSDGKA